MGAVLSSIPLCSRAQAPGGDTAETDQRPEDRQETVTVLAQPLPVQLQTNTPETCTATGIDNENHQEMIEEETEPAKTVEELQPSAVEEASQVPQHEEVEDGSVEV